MRIRIEWGRLGLRIQSGSQSAIVAYDNGSEIALSGTSKHARSVRVRVPDASCRNTLGRKLFCARWYVPL